MTSVKETLAGMVVKNLLEPVANSQLKNSCFSVAIRNDHGEIDVRIRGCEIKVPE